MKKYFSSLLGSMVVFFTFSSGYTMNSASGDEKEKPHHPQQPPKSGLIPPTRQAPPPLQYTIPDLGTPHADEIGRTYFKKDPPRSPPPPVKAQ